ncbi:MAG: glycosyltransferase [Candidatus Bathyarchaeia archaeon]
MKICAVTTWPPHRDGVALYSVELFKQVSKMADVTVVANVSQQNCPVKNVGTYDECWKRGLLYPMDVFRSVFHSRCNLVHVQHGWFLYGGILSSLLFPVLLMFFRISRKPCVVTLHTVIRKDAKIYNNFLVNFLAQIGVLWISRCIVHFSDKVIVHNPLMNQVLQTDYHANTEKIAVIPHGVKEHFSKHEPTQKSENFNILSLGFIRKEKSIENLVVAFDKFLETCPTAKLVIVGTTHAHDNIDYLEELKHRIKLSLQEHVIFMGFVDDNTLEQLIEDSDIIVLQSTEPYYVEASGTLAAVACYGKPVVCSKVPKFVAELQNMKNCVAVNSSDSTELAQAFVLLLTNMELRICLGNSLKEKFTERTWNNVAKLHINLYRCLLNKLTTKNTR